MRTAVVEGLKQFVRTFILGMIPIIVVALGVIKSGIDIEIGTFSIKWVLVLATLVGGAVGVAQTAIMSGADRWLHEMDVKTPLDLKGMDSLKK